MSIQTIIQSLDKLVSIHEELLSLSQSKTEIVKEGSIEKLQALLVKERKQIRLLEQVEAKRLALVEEWLKSEHPTAGNATISTMLDVLKDETEKEALAKVTTTLTNLITKLKQQEQLNQALLNQSMQFVQFSLDMMTPSISHMNYGGKNKDSESTGQSLFDSQA